MIAAGRPSKRRPYRLVIDPPAPAPVDGTLSRSQTGVILAINLGIVDDLIERGELETVLVGRTRRRVTAASVQALIARAMERAGYAR